MTAGGLGIKPFFVNKLLGDVVCTLLLSLYSLWLWFHLIFVYKRLAIHNRTLTGRPGGDGGGAAVEGGVAVSVSSSLLGLSSEPATAAGGGKHNSAAKKHTRHVLPRLIRYALIGLPVGYGLLSVSMEIACGMTDMYGFFGIDDLVFGLVIICYLVAITCSYVLLKRELQLRFVTESTSHQRKMSPRTGNDSAAPALPPAPGRSADAVDTPPPQRQPDGPDQTPTPVVRIGGVLNEAFSPSVEPRKLQTSPTVQPAVPVSVGGGGSSGGGGGGESGGLTSPPNALAGQRGLVVPAPSAAGASSSDHSGTERPRALNGTIRLHSNAALAAHGVATSIPIGQSRSLDVSRLRAGLRTLQQWTIGTFIIALIAAYVLLYTGVEILRTQFDDPVPPAPESLSIFDGIPFYLAWALLPVIWYSHFPPHPSVPAHPPSRSPLNAAPPLPQRLVAEDSNQPTAARVNGNGAGECRKAVATAADGAERNGLNQPGMTSVVVASGADIVLATPQVSPPQPLGAIESKLPPFGGGRSGGGGGGGGGGGAGGGGGLATPSPARLNTSQPLAPPVSPANANRSDAASSAAPNSLKPPFLVPPSGDNSARFGPTPQFVPQLAPTVLPGGTTPIAAGPISPPPVYYVNHSMTGQAGPETGTAGAAGGAPNVRPTDPDSRFTPTHTAAVRAPPRPALLQERIISFPGAPGDATAAGGQQTGAASGGDNYYGGAYEPSRSPTQPPPQFTNH